MGQVYLFYASVVQTFACITLNALICTFKGQLYVYARVIFHPSKRPIDTRKFSPCTRIITIHFKLPGLKYSSLFITGQIIVLIVGFFFFSKHSMCGIETN